MWIFRPTSKGIRSLYDAIVLMNNDIVSNPHDLDIATLKQGSAPERYLAYYVERDQSSCTSDESFPGYLKEKLSENIIRLLNDEKDRLAVAINALAVNMQPHVKLDSQTYSAQASFTS